MNVKISPIKASIQKLSNTGIFKGPLKLFSKIPGLSESSNASWTSEKTQDCITKLSIASLIIKDGFGCYLYVKQSLHNKKIPEDKRKFVAALDLTNGGLMILMQILAFKTISHPKIQKILFDKIFKKCIARPALKGYRSITDAVFEANPEYRTRLSGKEFHVAMDKYELTARQAFSQLSSLIAAAIVGKRIVVPFIATPLADKVEAYMQKQAKPVPVNKDTINTYDSQTAPADKMQNSMTSSYRGNEVKQTNLLDKYQKAQEPAIS